MFTPHPSALELLFTRTVHGWMWVYTIVRDARSFLLGIPRKGGRQCEPSLGTVLHTLSKVQESRPTRCARGNPVYYWYIRKSSTTNKGLVLWEKDPRNDLAGWEIIKWRGLQYTPGDVSGDRFGRDAQKEFGLECDWKLWRYRGTHVQCRDVADGIFKTSTRSYDFIW